MFLFCFVFQHKTGIFGTEFFLLFLFFFWILLYRGLNDADSWCQRVDSWYQITGCKLGLCVFLYAMHTEVVRF